ncbi:hypothetical protein [Orbus hercynius]|uniref:hypothetical protein n=1 Tax=Orbus hercynius TaxID=593135 RepID=UPI0011C453FC|nr:hypothetical protein [Orbus hercynius]
MTGKLANPISGDKPTLSAGHLVTIKSGNNLNLIGLKIDDKSYFTTAEVKKALSRVGIGTIRTETPNSITRKLGNGTGKISVVYKVLTDADASDLNGDRITILSSKTIKAGWYYMNGKVETALTTALSNQNFCDLATQTIAIVPYFKISGPLILSTQFGYPNTEVYDINDTNSPIWNTTQNPVNRLEIDVATACYTKPNLMYGTQEYQGLSSQWLPTKGFIPKHTSRQPTANTSGSFPTTGFNGAYFDVVLAGKTAQQIINNSRITAIAGSNVTLKLSTVPAKSATSNILRVELSGPSSGQKSAIPGKVAVNGLPATFELNDGESTIYQFTLSKWFIPKSGLISSAAAVNTFCADIAGAGKYKLGLRSDFTNSAYADSVIFPDDPTAASGISLSTGKHNGYTRAIGGGVFAEWGNPDGSTYYLNSDWENFYYWVSESWSSSLRYMIYSGFGTVGYGMPSVSAFRAACVSN